MRTNGLSIEKHEDIEQELFIFYQYLLTKSTPNRPKEINLVTNYIPCLISKDQIQTLIRSITLQELEQDITQMVDGKALGLYGLMINFFHHC